MEYITDEELNSLNSFAEYQEEVFNSNSEVGSATSRPTQSA